MGAGSFGLPDPPLLDDDDPPPLDELDPPPLDELDPPPLEEDVPPPLEEVEPPLLEPPPELLVEVSQMGSSSAGAGDVLLPQLMAMVHNAQSAMLPAIEMLWFFMCLGPFRGEAIRVFAY